MPRNSFWKEKRKTEMLSTPARKIQGKAKTTKTLVKHTSKLSPCGKREAMSGTRYVQSVFSTTYPQGVPPSFPGSGFYLQNPTLSNSPQRTCTAQIIPYLSMCPQAIFLDHKSFYPNTNICEETSLVVQWLRQGTPNAGGPGSIPGQGTRSHVPQLKIPHASVKMEDLACCN